MNNSSGIPNSHSGMHYYEFMADLSRKRNLKRYLEIGVNAGGLLARIEADVAVGVDPKFEVTSEIVNLKKMIILIQETSDRFFSSYNYAALTGGEPELCFLDGLHVYEYLLRDFINTEKISSAKTLICMHDCLPLDGVMAMRSVQQSFAAADPDTRFKGWWTGDVWKVIPILKKYRPDLEISLVDCFPTGVACVSNLDPCNTTLNENYFEIVREFHTLGTDQSDIPKFYDSIEIVRASDVLNEFDNTLFFRT